jgi:hypothetical protein
MDHINNTEIVMDEEEEGRRMMESIYEGSIANFASIVLSESPSLHIKPSNDGLISIIV